MIENGKALFEHAQKGLGNWRTFADTFRTEIAVPDREVMATLNAMKDFRAAVGWQHPKTPRRAEICMPRIVLSRRLIAEEAVEFLIAEFYFSSISFLVCEDFPASKRAK